MTREVAVRQVIPFVMFRAAIAVAAYVHETDGNVDSPEFEAKFLAIVAVAIAMMTRLAQYTLVPSVKYACFPDLVETAKGTSVPAGFANGIFGGILAPERPNATTQSTITVNVDTEAQPSAARPTTAETMLVSAVADTPRTLIERDLAQIGGFFNGKQLCTNPLTYFHERLMTLLRFSAYAAKHAGPLIAGLLIAKVAFDELIAAEDSVSHSLAIWWKTGLIVAAFNLFTDLVTPLVESGLDRIQQAPSCCRR